MANCAYFYSLSNRPTSYADRPQTISGLSQWPYVIPFSYRVLLSGDPQLCASLLSDGLEDEPAKSKTKLYAISADFEAGFARWKKFDSILRPLVASSSPMLIDSLDETLEFLEENCDRYLLLETVEIDTMLHTTEAPLRACVERELAECQRAGAAIDALPDDVAQAGAMVAQAARVKSSAPFDAFHGLALNDDFDNTRGGTEYPLGLEWCDELEYALWNRAEFEARQ